MHRHLARSSKLRYSYGGNVATIERKNHIFPRKGKSDLKQNGAQEKTMFSIAQFSFDLSLGVIFCSFSLAVHFVLQQLIEMIMCPSLDQTFRLRNSMI